MKKKEKGHEVKIDIIFENIDLTEIILKSLKPETRLKSRCSVKMSTQDCYFSLILIASDLTSIRAAMNSFTRWLDAIKTCIQVLNTFR